MRSDAEAEAAHAWRKVKAYRRRGREPERDSQAVGSEDRRLAELQDRCRDLDARSVRADDNAEGQYACLSCLCRQSLSSDLNTAHLLMFAGCKQRSRGDTDSRPALGAPWRKLCSS